MKTAVGSEDMTLGFSLMIVAQTLLMDSHLSTSSSLYHPLLHLHPSPPPPGPDLVLISVIIKYPFFFLLLTSAALVSI